MTFQIGLYRKVGGRGGQKGKQDLRTVEQRVLDRVDKIPRYDAAKIVAQTFVEEV